MIFPDEVMRVQKNFVVERDGPVFLAAIEAQGYKPLTKEEISVKFHADGAASVAYVLRSSCGDLFHVSGHAR